MADDIVTRLRRHDHDWLPDVHTPCDYCDALAEIERLTEWRANALHALDKREAVIERLRDAIDAVLLAITDKGSHPEYHDEVRRRHEREWPTLWRAIAAMQQARS